MTNSAQERTKPAGLFLAALFLGIAAFQVAATMLFPALPAIGEALDASPASISQTQAIFYAIGGLTAVSLPLSDRFGRKQMLMAVIVAGLLGSLLIIFSGNILLYGVGRCLQAFGVVALPLAFLILKDVISEEKYPLYLGWLSALNLGATGVDQAIAGWMVDNVGYKGIFWLAVVFGVAALASVSYAVPAVPATKTKTDWRGLMVIGIATLLLSVGLGQAGSRGWGSPVVLALLIGGVIAFAGFVFIEHATAEPLVEVKYLRSRSVYGLPLVILFGMAGFISTVSLIGPFFTQAPPEIGGFGMSATAYALWTIPGTVASFFLAPLCGNIARRFGWKAVLVIGTGLALTALLGMFAFRGNLVMVIIFLNVLAAFFAGATMTAANGLGIALSPSQSPAFLPGIVSVMFSFGSSLGSALAGSILAVPSAKAFSAAIILVTGLMLVAVILTVLVPRVPPVLESAAAHPQPAGAGA